MNTFNESIAKGIYVTSSSVVAISLAYPSKNELKNKILNLLKHYKKLDVMELSDLLSLSPLVVADLISDMKKEGLLG